MGGTEAAELPRTPAFILVIHRLLNSRFLFRRSLYAYCKPFSTRALATVMTFFERPRYPFASLNTLSLLIGMFVFAECGPVGPYFAPRGRVVGQCQYRAPITWQANGLYNVWIYCSSLI